MPTHHFVTVWHVENLGFVFWNILESYIFFSFLFSFCSWLSCGGRLKDVEGQLRSVHRDSVMEAGSILSEIQRRKWKVGAKYLIVLATTGQKPEL